MKDIRDPLYKKYYSAFKKGEPREKFGFLHIKLWYNEKYLPLLKGYDRNAPVLELGCGQGFMLRYLQSAGFTNLTGVDISEEQIAIAKERGFNAIHANAFDFLSSNEGQFEIIFAIDLIEHFKKEELFELLQLTHQALKPGGLFVLQTPNGEGLMPGYVIYGDLTHFTILSPLSLKHILTVTNFDNIKIKELGPGLFVHFPLFVVWQIIRLFAMFIKFMEIGRIQRHWTESIIASARRPK
ncbi:MAG: class I SAM-dependent methyltransferase [Chloroflexi bacterium]|nr:class I SAM-dependent methyltransferase [Chloroflexota bacterium]